MKTPVFATTFPAFYKDFWPWWHRACWRGPSLSSGSFIGAPGVFTLASPTVRDIQVGVGFSGAGKNVRAVKAEIYVQDIRHLRFQELLRAIDADEPWVRPLWAGVREGVHRHAHASQPTAPGVYAVAGAGRLGTASKVPANAAAVPSQPTLGRTPQPVDDSVAIEHAGNAGRIVTFMKDAVDLSRPDKVEAAGARMASTLSVFRSVLA